MSLTSRVHSHCIFVICALFSTLLPLSSTTRTQYYGKTSTNQVDLIDPSGYVGSPNAVSRDTSIQRYAEHTYYSLLFTFVYFGIFAFAFLQLSSISYEPLVSNLLATINKIDLTQTSQLPLIAGIVVGETISSILILSVVLGTFNLPRIPLLIYGILVFLLGLTSPKLGLVLPLVPILLAGLPIVVSRTITFLRAILLRAVSFDIWSQKRPYGNLLNVFSSAFIVLAAVISIFIIKVRLLPLSWDALLGVIVPTSMFFFTIPYVFLSSASRNPYETNINENNFSVFKAQQLITTIWLFANIFSMIGQLLSNVLSPKLAALRLVLALTQTFYVIFSSISNSYNLGINGTLTLLSLVIAVFKGQMGPLESWLPISASPYQFYAGLATIALNGTSILYTYSSSFTENYKKIGLKKANTQDRGYFFDSMNSLGFNNFILSSIGFSVLSIILIQGFSLYLSKGLLVSDPSAGFPILKDIFKFFKVSTIGAGILLQIPLVLFQGINNLNPSIPKSPFSTLSYLISVLSTYSIATRIIDPQFIVNFSSQSPFVVAVGSILATLYFTYSLNNVFTLTGLNSFASSPVITSISSILFLIFTQTRGLLDLPAFLAGKTFLFIPILALVTLNLSTILLLAKYSSFSSTREPIGRALFIFSVGLSFSSTTLQTMFILSKLLNTSGSSYLGEIVTNLIDNKKIFSLIAQSPVYAVAGSYLIRKLATLGGISEVTEITIPSNLVSYLLASFLDESPVNSLGQVAIQNLNSCVIRLNLSQQEIKEVTETIKDVIYNKIQKFEFEYFKWTF